MSSHYLTTTTTTKPTSEIFFLIIHFIQTQLISISTIYINSKPREKERERIKEN